MDCTGFSGREIRRLKLASNYSHPEMVKIPAYPRKISVLNKGCLYGFHITDCICQNEGGFDD
jgi:hypothetical protein